MVAVFHTITRLQVRVHGTESGQYQYATAHKEWQILQQEKDQHIKAKFFFIKDKVDDGEVQVLDCPTGEMWADVLTKPYKGWH